MGAALLLYPAKRRSNARARRSFGWFSVYELASQIDDLDFVLHMGDYTYEARGRLLNESHESLAGA